MSELKLGKLIEGDQQRDAIHVAVAPMVANEPLRPGEDVGISEGTADRATRNTKRLLGIVDPFLRVNLEEGDRFWMFLYPNTVTGMRHHWQHPSFGESVAKASDSVKAESEAWLRDYAMRHNCYDDPERAYERLIEGLKSEELYFHGSDLNGFYELDEPEELKRHAAIALGVYVDWDKFGYSCSC